MLTTEFPDEIIYVLVLMLAAKVIIKQVPFHLGLSVSFSIWMQMERFKATVKIIGIFINLLPMR